MTNAPDVSPTAEKRPRRGMWIAIIAVAAVLVIGAAVAIPLTIVNQAQAAAEAEAKAEAKAERQAERRAEALRRDEIRAALDSCGIQPVGNTTLLDGGEAAEIARVSKYDGPAIADLYCTLEALGAPQSLESKIGQTRALDGRQTSEWGDFAISWTYHPDDGATVLIERTDAP